MATMTVSLPDALKDWIESEVRRGEYTDVSDYVSGLVRRDRSRREQELTLDDLREKLKASEQSGISHRSVNDIFEEAVATTTRAG